MGAGVDGFHGLTKKMPYVRLELSLRPVNSASVDCNLVGCQPVRREHLREQVLRQSEESFRIQCVVAMTERELPASGTVKLRYHTYQILINSSLAPFRKIHFLHKYDT